ncbi:MAG TPA: rRNA maturation RNase YbeY [Bacteroidales bacterium]|nr:rRNA maturation RNase YbeY [Bacteroidales bacterium]
MSIKIFYDVTGYKYNGWKKLQILINRIIEEGKMVPGEINFIITSDEKLRSINVEFLEHDYYTDVITFNYNVNEKVSGEVYLSIDTVKENAHLYNVSLYSEITRVMIHGILHLIGYDDKTVEEKYLMRKKEDYWLGILGE